ncbi:cytochrome P450 [Collybia nuda]|uniref:Cytochrome P450 n=1 Tax=Collybia nuda TaxID=64659 RepID=A0A9P5XWA2_9AGAR|nr:cytochrome P450 [Collybia nuda]
MYLFALGCVLLFYVYLRTRSKRHPPLPPGPPADPVIGHLRLIHPENQQTLFYQWGKTYGDVMYLHVFGRSLVVLNSVQAAVDLLEKRGANYSDRPHILPFEIMGWTSALTLLRYGKRFQRHRRMFQIFLDPSKCLDYQSVQRREARVLLRNLMRNSNSRETFLRQFSTAIIIRIVHGHQITSDNDPYVQIALATGYAISNAGPPGNTAVDLFPFLQHLPAWFPGAYYASFARKHKFTIDTLHDYPLEQVLNQMAEGKANTSFLSTQLEERDRDGTNYPNTIEDIKGAAGTMYCAGADTTWSTISIFFLAMVLNPECQARAQQEIESVVGPDRLPEFEDRPSLPYVECLMQEAFRWNSAVPTGIPHRSLEDDIYNGMFIPKGSIIIPNQRGMTLDENVYRDPTTFNPSRYLPEPEGNAEPYPNVFGFGRRICPGRYLADASVWIAIASVLATLDISKAVDSNGKEIIPEVAFTSGITSLTFLSEAIHTHISVPFDPEAQLQEFSSREVMY